MPDREGKEKGKEGMSILMRSWNRAAGWLRPALDLESQKTPDRQFATKILIS